MGKVFSKKKKKQQEEEQTITQKKPKKKTFKVIIIGTPGSGKTCLMIRLTKNEFNKTNAVVEKASISYKGDDGEEVTISFHDTTGQEQFRNLTSYFFKNADLVIVTVDLTSSESYFEAEGYIQEAEKYLTKSYTGLLIGTKLDLKDKRVVDSGSLTILKEKKKYNNCSFGSFFFR